MHHRHRRFNRRGLGHRWYEPGRVLERLEEYQRDLEQELADVAAFLRAFGVKERPESHERIDHVAMECEFLSLLSVKEAWALEHEDTLTTQAELRLLKPVAATRAAAGQGRVNDARLAYERHAAARGFTDEERELVRVVRRLWPVLVYKAP